MPYPIKFVEVEEGQIYDHHDFTVTAFRVKHPCETYGYVLEEKKEENLNVEKLKKLGIYNNPVCRKLK